VVRGSGAVTLSLDMGARIQIATSAMGRAYITAVSNAKESKSWSGAAMLVLDDRWLEINAGVDQAMRDIRELGVCLLLR